MKNQDKIIIVSGDIFSCLTLSRNIGWDSVKELSINRILYFASIMYSFKFPLSKNIFEDDYKFTITLRGPEEPIIQNALIHLQSNYIIKKNLNGYELLVDKLDITDNLPYFDEKKKWLEDIIYIFGVYGEDKLYDFIFRDPEYKDNLRSNSQKRLNISKTNQTIKFLEGFKQSFEKTINSPNDNLNNKQYLELYFEYVFGKILRGEPIDE